MAKGTTKSNGQKHENDKFYTKPEVAAEVLRQVSGKYDLWIEPSAGSGAFSQLVPGCLALDIAPEAEGIVEQDWFSYNGERLEGRSTIVFGNPPFGQQNSLAVRFINHAATFADAVAFILPRSFKKESVQNRLDPHLHIIHEYDLPRNSFTLNGKDYDVPCVFQVWEYRAEVRQKKTPEKPRGFRFVKRSENPHISIQRVGGRAGYADTNPSGKSESSHYFILFTRRFTDDEVAWIAEKFNGLSHPARDYSVGPRSLSKGDITGALNDIIIEAAERW